MAQGSAAKRAVRKLAAFVGVVLIAVSIVIASMYSTATSDPVVRRAALDVPGLPVPIRVVLVSDVHVARPDMPPQRLSRIVAQINGLDPDLVLVAGDLVSDKRLATRRYSLADAIAPLGDLDPRLGTFAVLGNHDHWRDAREARLHLRRAGIQVLDNDAARAGPLTVGGLDDAFTGHDDLDRTVQRMRSYPGPRILVSHSPDPFPQVPPDVVLMAAGHTHCGQIRLPVVGALSTMSRYGERYACGRITEGQRTLIVSAGLGTSLLPLRLGAEPDLWLIELRPGGKRS